MPRFDTLVTEEVRITEKQLRDDTESSSDKVLPPGIYYNKPKVLHNFESPRVKKGTLNDYSENDLRKKDTNQKNTNSDEQKQKVNNNQTMNFDLLRNLYHGSQWKQFLFNTFVASSDENDESNDTQN